MPMTVLIACAVSLGIGISKVVNSGQVRHVAWDPAGTAWRGFINGVIGGRPACRMQTISMPLSMGTCLVAADHVNLSDGMVPIVSCAGFPAAQDDATGVAAVDDLQHGAAVPAAVVLAHRQGHHAAHRLQVRLPATSSVTPLTLLWSGLL